MTTKVHCDECGKVIDGIHKSYIDGDIKFVMNGPQGRSNRQVSIRGDYCDAECVINHIDRVSRNAIYAGVKAMQTKYPE